MGMHLAAIKCGVFGIKVTMTLLLEGYCNVKIKKCMLEIDSSSCTHDRKIVLDC